MWWLDDETLAGSQTRGDLSNPRPQDTIAQLRVTQLLAEIFGTGIRAHNAALAVATDDAELSRQPAEEKERLPAAEAQLAESGVRHAEQLSALRIQIQALEETVTNGQVGHNELLATIGQRDGDHAEQLARLQQACQNGEAALRECELQRMAEVQLLRSELDLLRASLRENELIRSDLEARFDQRDSSHAAELAVWALETESLQSKLQTLQKSLFEAETARTDLEAESTRRDLSRDAELVALTQASQQAEAALRESESQRVSSHTAELVALTQARREAEVALCESESQRAAEAQSLRSELELLQGSLNENATVRSDLEAALEQRVSSHTVELVALTRARREAEVALCESESQRAAEVQSLRSELELLQGSLNESESVRSDLATRLEQRDSSHAAEFAVWTQQTESLQSKSHILQKSLAEAETARTNLEAAIAQRDSSREAELVALTQAWQASEAALQERESQRAAEMQALQSDLRTLEQALVESETARDSLQSAITQQDATNAARLVEAENARESVVVRADELSAQLISIKKEAAGLQSDLVWEINRRAAADLALQLCHAVHAGEVASVQTQIHSLQQSLDTQVELRCESETAAAQREVEYSVALAEAKEARKAAEQRANQFAAQLATMDNERASLQDRLEAETRERLNGAAGWRELERQHARHTESLQSKLLTLEELIREYEAARLASNSEWTQAREEYAAELAKLDEARRAAERCNKELELQLQSLQHQLDSTATRADQEFQSRVRAEAELQRLGGEFGQLSDDAERTLGQYQALQHHSAQLQQEFNACEKQLRERDAQIACQASELEQRRDSEQRGQRDQEQLASQYVKHAASFEAQIAELRSVAEAEQASRVQAEHELEKLRDVSATAVQAQQAAELRLEEQLARIQTLARELNAARSYSAETESRKSTELADMRSELTNHASELAASRDQAQQFQQQLQAAIQNHQDEQESRRAVEALAESLTRDVALLRKTVEAFRGLAQREAASRRKLETAIKRSHDDAHSLLAIRASIEVNERIRKLATELTAARKHELSVRQRATREIKRAQDELQQLRDQLAKVQKAA